jgi:hypothetical protein
VSVRTWGFESPLSHDVSAGQNRCESLDRGPFANRLLTEHQPRHRFGRVLLHGRRRVAVDVERDSDARVAEALLHDLGMDTDAERQRGPCMPKIMESDTGESTAPHALVEVPRSPTTNW